MSKPAATYRTRRKLTQAELDEIATLYQYRIPPKIIGQAYDLGYQKINQLIQVIKLTHTQHSPNKIRKDLVKGGLA